MKCPVLAAPLSSEHIQCDPDFIQVERHWSLALGGSLVVALEDASLIQVYVDIHKPYITVQGRRNTILSPVLQTEGQFLPLKLVSGNYAYSMEATCPTVTMYSSENTVLHIYKRRMGLTKRGGYDSETLSVSSVSVNQTSAFTWSENSGFVKLIIPTALIQKMKKCTEKEGRDLQQAFLRIDVVLTFKETNNKMVWTMENMSPCLGGLSRFVPTTPSYVTHEANLDSDDASSLGLHGSSLSTGETSSAITTEPSNLTADISTATDGSISKAARSGVAPPHHGEVNTMVKWTPVTSPLPLESTSLSLLDLKEVIIPKTVSDVPLNTRSASQKLLQLHRGHTQLSLTPPSPDIVMHSTGTNQTEPIHTPDEQVAGKYAPPR
uniref:CIROZ beta domain-containing protein n=1 Tax=Electrophorus electricus TaxID=8005 RepID=A0AAY5EP41_ELEEL